MNTLERIAARIADDLIPGGEADDVSPENFDPESLQQGTEVEMEHTDDPAIAEEIARDHLTEFDDYYDALREMENELEKRRRRSRSAIVPSQ